MNIDNIPLEDGFQSQIAQEYNGGTGTLYLRSVPSFTFPSGFKTQITIDPNTPTKRQVVTIDSIDTGEKTVNVSSISSSSGSGDSYTQKTHKVGTKVVISFTYDQLYDIAQAVNSKIDGTTQPIYFYATTAARDAALGATPSTDGLFVGSTADQTIYYSAGGTRNPFSAGDSVTPNMSTTVAGKGEKQTAAELAAGTATGGTGAPLVVTPDVLAPQIQSGTWTYGADAGGDDTYVVALTPVLTTYTTGQSLYAKVTTANTGACSFDFGPGAKSVKTKDGNDPQTGVLRANGIAHLVYDGTNLILQDEDFATTNNKGTIAMATDAIASAITGGTDETKCTNSKQLANWSGYTVYAEQGALLADLVSLLQSANTANSHTNGSYTKVKEIVATVAGTYTVYFEIKADASTTAYGRIYVGGVATGTERSTTSTSYVGYVQNITVTAGQLIQLYVYKTGTNSGYYQNFRLYGFIKPNSLTLTVNQN